ncbi:hypothetical protein RRG08_046826 [Elysia crispata]|uniref:Uncharacterized protein n=1 Tax=Elysia crispata TaxID=231223 RepID=A0AAE0ZN44_9GAST|nr:hypothetical protein RRG08_046826 [Elysia crispata]
MEKFLRPSSLEKIVKTDIDKRNIVTESDSGVRYNTELSDKTPYRQDGYENMTVDPCYARSRPKHVSSLDPNLRQTT